MVKDIDTFFTYENDYPKEAFQATVYTYIMKKLHPEKTYQPNLFFIQVIGSESKATTLQINGEEIITFDGELLTQFEEKLLELTNAIADPENTFEPTDNPKACTNCDFKAFCNKEGAESFF